MRGRCLCGAVTFAVTPPLLSAAHCHCDSCRRAHSAAFVSWGRVAKPQLVILTGAPGIQGHMSSPGAHRSFCSDCGTPLFMRYDNEPADVYVPLATLVDPPSRVPDKHLSYEEKVSWFSPKDGLPRVRAKSAEPL